MIFIAAYILYTAYNLHMAATQSIRRMGMRQMRLAFACLIFVSVGLTQAADRNYAADPALYDLMDQLPAALFSYTGHPNSYYWPQQVPAAPHLTIYAPQTQDQAVPIRVPELV
jgi:hypothetical protein